MSRIVRVRYGASGSPLTYKTLDFPRFTYKMTPPDIVRQTLSGGKSASGIVETLTVRTDVLIDIAFRHCLNREEPYITLKRNLKQWEQCAQRGDDWTLALDSTDTVLTTITNSPAAGDTTIDLASVTGIVAGRSYVLRNEVDVEVVKVAFLSVLQATLTEPLNFSFFAGDRFRSEMFWPARLVDARPVIVENGPLWYDVELRFVEDVNGL